MILKSVIMGFLGATALLAVYFTAVSLISGWFFALDQFGAYWYFIIGLALGFGIQIGLYTYLKDKIHRQQGAGKILAVSGTTSTVAMISCCAHYLANILPVIGATGIIGAIGQYQIEFFWVGLAFNIAGIMYIGRKVFKFHPVRDEVNPW